jgi:hypothetical protein
LKETNRQPSFLKSYSNLSEVLTDKQLASLGDAYINFVYSLALSKRKGKPYGAKVKGTVLAEALRKAGLRQLLPSRIDRHVLSDSAESLLVYAWLRNLLTLEESVETIAENSNLEFGLTQLMLKAKDRIKLSGLFPVPY